MFPANPTHGFEKVQLVAVGVVALAVGGTATLHWLGLPTGGTGVVFIVLFTVLMGLAWPLFTKFQPDHGQTESD
ncbi:hypothetical protein [Natrononativus amylolyticus]|uniref:hypothetical protein n=1 Tax=Natrononativus amylolyticus TaxID=2963434 RepID=UPI0020CB90D2|nr:hypothetical protein [Natrononativus amylolyticus]